MKILMVASENDAVAGGKVGGIGDVLRDIPPALAETGCEVDVVTPGYLAFSKLPGSNSVGKVSVSFAGRKEVVELFQIPSREPTVNVTLWALEHPLFAAGGAGAIYCDDPGDRPFASDASKFALFCVAVAEAVRMARFGPIDVLHLHDWHAAMVAVLRAYDPVYKSLQAIRTVYTIHNLSLQGVRPIAGDESALLSWFPGLQTEGERITDPRAPHCINPMRAGINLSDAVHAVSPNYADEILRPSDTAHGFVGGEGLEKDLQQVANQGRLHGILNGCDYSLQNTEAISGQALLGQCEQAVLQWLGQEASAASAHVIALARIRQRLATKANPAMLMTSIGRITTQKVSLLQARVDDSSVSALDVMLQQLGEDGLFILLGSGDSELEQFFSRAASTHSNFLFLKGYSESLAQVLYATGKLFLMPSSFEPCGISQMLAMRAGQPCLVHAVGGLKDTVQDGKNGFSFSGEASAQQVANMLCAFQEVLSLSREDSSTWQKISRNAREQRFEWNSAAREYQRLLYRGLPESSA